MSGKTSQEAGETGRKVQKFEDLIAWQKARHLARSTYDITGTGGFRKDYGLRDQMRRASVSVMSNVAEGFERGSRAEFHHSLVIAKGSCAELRSQLYVALDVGYVEEETFRELYALSVETARVIGGLRAAVQRQRDR